MTSIVIFGAGAIGRGFVGALFGAAGWRITFIDVDTALVDRLNADGGYRVVEVSHDGERPVPIDQVGALAFADGGAVAEALAGADLDAVSRHGPAPERGRSPCWCAKTCRTLPPS